MPKVTWDTSGSRTYESGIDQGVLYHADGSGIPWNGLTAIIETNTQVVTPTYYDGKRVADKVQENGFAGTLSAVTYPDEFLYYEGTSDITAGVGITDQLPKTFHLSYRTRIADETGETDSYKLHVLYNVTAIPSDKAYNTWSDSQTITQFQWNLTAIPEEYPGYRPSSHIIFDERRVDPQLWEIITTKLYGSDGVDAHANLPSYSELMDIVSGYYTLEIVDNKDGTWSAITNETDYIYVQGVEGVYPETPEESEFRIDNADATVVADFEPVYGDNPPLSYIPVADGTYTITDIR